MKLQGILIPIAIPFDHNGDIYPVKIRHNVEKWNRTGVSGYVVSGRESIYLTAEEKIRVWEWTAEYSAPEKIRIASTGMPSVRETVELSNRAESLGYKAASIGVPHAAVETQKIYLSAVADQSRIPILIDGAAPEGLSHPNILDARIGRSSGSIARDFAGGAAAVICDIANAIPYAAICIWEAHRTRESDAAEDWQNRIAPAARLIEQYGIAALKHAMDLNGYYGGPPRLPLTVLTPAQRREVEQAFSGLRG
ncbi:MAG TPA: dihydrodipicolinate synthase family protein [Bryobacteraceae bacterium]|jgi:4-hydroxy-2-oxoglutarate aldolase|nr:dihydrodipicolinate synthase family protein [Bryobacteraceae bacterium]